MHASRDDIINAYKNLTANDLDSLHDYAARRIRDTSFPEPEDLIQETMLRVLAGSRKWPLRAPFGLFLRLAMRSVVQVQWKQREKKLVVQMPDDFEIDAKRADGEAESPVESRMLSLERLQEADEAVSLARKELKDDLAAQRVIDGILWGTPPRETRAELGMSERDFDAARQRAARRLREAGEIVKQRAESTRKPCKRAPNASRHKPKR
ncbi:hypothetical protein [Burkholderia gladioli]|uniref:hypothetical protein n=1 Tax=Burkholderia gladioli TaxID=28095 RepID=UPI000F547543|nr:hypothetical protein [Burkholderia gladioli]MBU9276938.1 hypothetical protein [Burkholderia gladioli]